MRICRRPTRIEFLRFGRDYMKGWLFKSAHYFQVNNIPNESKVNFIATHLFGIALLWHEQILKFVGKDMAWVIYKDLILKRFSNVKTTKFSFNNVMDTSITLHFDDEENYVIYGCYQKRDEKDNSVLKVYEEMPIKKVFKQDTNAEYSDVKESIKVGSGLVEEVVVETVKEPFEEVKEGNGWFKNQIIETTDKSKMDSGYVMRRNKELLGFVWKPMVRMRMNGSIMSGNYYVSGITRESEVIDESQISDNTP
nr:hypothetical protein [Tanacetum cinerariifolium]